MDAASWRWTRTSGEWLVGLTNRGVRIVCLTCVSTDGTSEVGVNWARQSVVSKSVPGDTPRAEVFSR